MIDSDKGRWGFRRKGLLHMSTDILIELPGGELSGRRNDVPTEERLPRGPLIVALHGGSYSSAFFDIPGFSLLDRAAASGCLAVALDRPGYRTSTLPEGEGLLAANAERIDAAVNELWDRYKGEASGVVLVGHSIGSAISILVAAREPAWPLRGIAVSGVGLSLPPGGPAYQDPDVAAVRISVPDEVKNTHMFGPPGSYPEGAKEKAAVANRPVVYREVFEMNTEWCGYARDVCARVRVPVHYRQGELDGVWAKGHDELQQFARAFTNSPAVDARIVENAAHCIDFHNNGPAFQDGEIAFAIACASGGKPDGAAA